MSATAVLPAACPDTPAAVPQPRPRRRRRSVLFGSIILFFLIGSTIATLAVLLEHEPTFYRRASVPPGPERRSLAVVFMARAANLRHRAKDFESLDETFNEEHINSFFEEQKSIDEEFLRSQDIKFRWPDDITDPRIAFEADRIRLGFRYHVGRFSTIVSIALRVWVTQAESNVLAVEIQGIRAGALPISSQSILERLSAAAESNNIKLSWYRLKGNPVAVLHFPSAPHTKVQLDTIDLHPGKLFIKGLSAESVMKGTDAKH